MASRKRYIDELPIVKARPVKMEVLCLGLSRTGTTSMYMALPKIGLPSYHFVEPFFQAMRKDVTQPMRCWREAVNAKYCGEGQPWGKNNPWGREEFDKLLQNYGAVMDAPAHLFVDELVAAYPEAKIVLTTRDVDSWIRSLENTFLVWLSWPFFNTICALEPYVGRSDAGVWIIKKVFLIWTGYKNWPSARPYEETKYKLRQAYAEHYAHVRAIVPKDRLLEYYPAEGWEPLCKFLGKEIPAEPFPNTNNPGQTNMNLWQFYKVIARSTVWNILSFVSMTTAPIAAAGLGYAVYRFR